ncbi:MAG: glycosyltransferase family 2 protein [Candidatus Lindowbacteria bacterium]|nr:glycosyltransferase family 2 protein [Candidatus Lindowbacteria bacterium]
MNHKADLSVVIPAYNEAGRIGPTIETVSAYLSTRGIDYEIIVVSDGSTDSTDEVVGGCAKKDPRVKLISYHPNRGKGCAVRMGMLEARSDNVLFTDADLATPISELETLEKRAANELDIIVGSRALKESRIIGWRPWYRELSGKVFNRVVRLLAVPVIRDTQCGFKYFRKGSASRIFSAARLNGFGFDVEALYLARKFGYRVGEVGVSWKNSPATKVSVMRDTLPMVCEIIRVRLNDWKKRYEVRSQNG